MGAKAGRRSHWPARPLSADSLGAPVAGRGNRLRIEPHVHAALAYLAERDSWGLGVEHARHDLIKYLELGDLYTQLAQQHGDLHTDEDSADDQRCLRFPLPHLTDQFLSRVQRFEVVVANPNDRSYHHIPPTAMISLINQCFEPCIS